MADCKSDVKQVPCKKETTAKERVQIELFELNEKIVGLTKMLYGEALISLDITDDMIALLEQQLKAMRSYAVILQQRLSIWDDRPKARFYHPFNG